MTENDIIQEWNFAKMIATNIGSVTLSKERVLALDDLINRQKDEIERLKTENGKLKSEMSYMINPNTIGDRHEMGGW